MYLECSPFLEKERDGGGPIAPMEQHDFDRNYLVGICQKWEVGKCQKTVVGKCPRKPSLLENVRNFFVGK